MKFNKHIRSFLALVIVAVIFSFGNIITSAADDEDLSVPYVGDNFYLSKDGEVPHKISNEDGWVKELLPKDCTLYIEIMGATRSYEVAGYRSFIKWNGEEVYPIYPPIEYRQVTDYDGITSLGYKFLIAFKFSELDLQKEITTLSGEVRISKKVSGVKNQRSFKFSIRGDKKQEAIELYAFDSYNPIFNASSLSGDVGIQLGSDASLYFDCNDMWDVDLTYSVAADDRVVSDDNLKFLSFVYSPVFNKRFTLIIPADKSRYIYQIVGDKLVELDASYDEGIGAFKHYSYSLGRYVVSETPLDQFSLKALKVNPQNGATA